MRINILITCAALAAVSIITAFIITIAVPEPSQQPLVRAEASRAGNQVDNIPQGPDSAPPPAGGDEYQYTLKEYHGRLAVYFKDEPNPQKVFDVYLSTLPSYDRGQLQLGVRVKDYEELVQRIEDYIS